MPLISILLPVKDSGRFLKERLDTILEQTIHDWELIIVDSHSTDGSLAVLQDLAEKDDRVSLYECPPGLYQAWNFAIRQAKGKYVYIATADDTMTADALEKMSSALEAHPECSLCDSLLKLIDADGNEIREFNTGYAAHLWHLSYPQDRMHIRKRYSDFLVHLGGKTVYTSVTQLLIRRTLFEKAGFFPENYGPRADYLWGMRASLYTDVVFLPEFLSSWRIHTSQLTFSEETLRLARENRSMKSQMAREVLKEASPEIAAEGRKVSHLIHFKEFLSPARENKCSALEKMTLIGRALLHEPLLTLEYLLTMPFYLQRIPRAFILIYTYDKMIYRHTKRFYRDKIVECGA